MSTQQTLAQNKESAKYYQTGSYESDAKYHKYVAWCEVLDENMNRVEHPLNKSCRGTWKYCHANIKSLEKEAKKTGLMHTLTAPDQEAGTK